MRDLVPRAYVRPASTSRAAISRKGRADLSGGERNRVHLAKMLKSGGNVLLLDEPTNDLDVDTLRRWRRRCSTFPGCAIVISHDRWFLDRIATHILAFEGDSQVDLVRGQLRRLREGSQAPPRRRGRRAPPDQVVERARLAVQGALFRAA